MSETLTPVFRLEYFIVAAANGTPCDLEPIFNEEKYLHAIAGASVDLPMPIGRTQEYLAKLAGMDVEIPDHPIFRTEYYLAHMIDSTVECPAPIFREEMFYYEWASNEYVTITGNPVSFTAKAAPLRQLSVACSPVQDLHGYDNPWPAGGGKNKINAPDVTLDAAGYIFNGAVNLPAGTYTINFSGAVNSASMAILDADGNAMVTGSHNVPYTFTLNADAVSARFYVASAGTYSQIQIEAGSAPTSYAPYSNICPILGWDSLNVEQRGKNLLTATEYCGIHYASGVGADLKTTRAGISYTENGNEITITAGGWQGWIFATGLLAVGDYYIHFNCNDSNFRGAAFVTDENLIVTRANMTYGGGADGNTKITLTEPSRIAFFAACGSTGSATITNPQVELGSSYTEWQPYNPSSRSISINLGQTVYSGWVDVVTGVCTVTWVSRTVDDSGTAARLGYGSYPYLLLSGGEIYKSSENPCLALASNAVPTSVNNDYIVRFANGIGGVSSLADFQTLLHNNPMQLVVALKTPQTIQLTPQEVQSLAGDNVLFSDANGDLTVTYRSN